MLEQRGDLPSKEPNISTTNGAITNKRREVTARDQVIQGPASVF